MSTFPLVLDAAPPYLRTGSAHASSLLLTPMGSGSLLCRLHARLGVGLSNLIVVPTFRPDAAYRQALREACDQVSRVIVVEELHEMVSTLEASDWLLFLDPQCATEDPIDPQLLQTAASAVPRSAVHLVALESNAGGTREWVDVDERGDVARIQRFYDELTWSYASGVAASLVPVPYLLTDRRVRFGSLRELRTALVSRGAPARDLPLAGHAFDLSRERELLLMADRIVRASTSRGEIHHVAQDAAVDDTARLIGPIVVQAGASIGPRATLVGPAIVGAGASIGADALVVQAIVQPAQSVADGAVVRHRVVSQPAEPADAAPPHPGAYDPSSVRAFRAVRTSAPPDRRMYPAIKRALDFTISAAALLLLLPLFAVIAVLIKLESRGPIFFADRREAKGGRNFPCFKFRTMVHGADAMQRELLSKNQVDGPQFKLDKDPRLTRVGRWIRPCSIDELPQLINVLRGDMSLVGPRPSPFRENQTCVPWREGRLSVRPGITGLWQVCRHDRDKGDFHQWIHYDLLYVEHMSAPLDLKIVIATVATLGGKWCVPLTWMIPRRRLQQAA